MCSEKKQARQLAAGWRSPPPPRREQRVKSPPPEEVTAPPPRLEAVQEGERWRSRWSPGPRRRLWSRGYQAGRTDRFSFFIFFRRDGEKEIREPHHDSGAVGDMICLFVKARRLCHSSSG